MIEHLPTAVYRFFDANGVLLYVGITDQPKPRWRWHAKHSPWWSDVADRRITWYDERRDAAAEEARAITEDQPLHNVLGAAASPQTSGKTPNRPIRIDDVLWERFGQAATTTGTDRSNLVRQFARWYSGEPDAELPVRPNPTAAIPA